MHFRLLDKPKQDDFSLELYVSGIYEPSFNTLTVFLHKNVPMFLFSHLSRSKRSTYDDVVEKVAQHLGLDDPSKLRLTQHIPHLQQPKPQYIKYRSIDHLSDMLHHLNQVRLLFYVFVFTTLHRVT